MKQNTSKYLVLFWAIISLLVAISAYVYIRYDINQAIINVQVKQNNLTKNNAFDLNTQERLLKLYNETGSDRGEINSLTLNRDDAVKLIEYLENLAKISSTTLNIGGLNVYSLEIDPRYAELATHVTVRGRWENVMKYIKLSEFMPNMISRLQNLSLTSSVSIPGKNKKPISEWTANFDLRIIIKDNG